MLVKFLVTYCHMYNSKIIGSVSCQVSIPLCRLCEWWRIVHTPLPAREIYRRRSANIYWGDHHSNRASPQSKSKQYSSVSKSVHMQKPKLH